MTRSPRPAGFLHGEHFNRRTGEAQAKCAQRIIESIRSGRLSSNDVDSWIDSLAAEIIDACEEEAKRRLSGGWR